MRFLPHQNCKDFDILSDKRVRLRYVKLSSSDYIDFFIHLGSRWVIGGDSNAKHAYWGCRLNSLKDAELYSAINQTHSSAVSSGKPTYWLSNRNKISDYIDVLITRGIGVPYTHIDNGRYLTSDHSLIVLSENMSMQI